MAPAASIDSPTTFGTVTVRPWQLALTWGDGLGDVAPLTSCDDCDPREPGSCAATTPTVTAIAAIAAAASAGSRHDFAVGRAERSRDLVGREADGRFWHRALE